MIRSRMQNSVEHLLTRTQYGFRPSKSTSHAIYLIRRLQDFAESKAAKLSIAWLDRQKAFDKIQHDTLWVALYRLGFSQHYIDVIADCYRTPTFLVKDDFGTSTVKEQRSGIRQGCPLSPFLSTLAMSCISDFQKLNAFQLRGIRKILIKAPTYIDRTNTNARLLEEASMIACPSRNDQRKILVFSEFHNLRRAKLRSYTS